MEKTRRFRRYWGDGSSPGVSGAAGIHS